MTVRVDVRPELLEWALERSRLPEDTWTTKFEHLEKWLSGDRKPTLKQLEGFAKATHTPVGFLFLQEPPEESLPVADFRVVAGSDQARPSADLLDVLYVCQQRQEWYRDDARAHGEPSLEWVGSVTTATPVADAAAEIAAQLGWNAEARRAVGDVVGAWTELRRRIENVGVLVMITGHVGSNTHRALKVGEFRGFALSDDQAPLIFVNGVDAKAAQVFTLIHELAHLWLGNTGLDDLFGTSEADAAVQSTTDNAIERWCNAVAAEVLVPLAELRAQLDDVDDLPAALPAIARRFRVSKLVVLGRAREVGFISWDQYWQIRADLHQQFLASPPPESSGGNFYPGLFAATSRRFTEALIASTLEGRTLYRDAFQMLGIKSQTAFDGIVERLVAD